jgi:hypothetical protein
MKKYTFAKVMHWLAATILFANLLTFSSQGASAQRPSTPAFSQLEVDTQLDFNDPAHQVCSATSNDCSLRGAISKANANSSRSYQVILPAGTYTLSIPGAGEDANATGDLDVGTSLLLTGAGAGNTSIDAQAIDRAFQIHPWASLTVEGITITGGKTMDGVAGTPGGKSEDGGGFYNTGSLILVGSIVTNNGTGAGGAGGNGGWDYSHGGSSGKGGGIYNTGGLILDHTNILWNYSGNGGNGASGSDNQGACGYGGGSGNGGGIYNSGNLWLKESQLADNIIGTSGSGGQSATTYRCGNGPGGSGGGVYNTGHMQVQSSFLISNRAGCVADTGGGGRGGGIYSMNWLEIDDSQVNGNWSGDGSCGGSGGGIYNTGWLEVNHSQILGNWASGVGSGGGIYNDNQARMIGSSVGYNTSDGRGGGIYNAGNLILTSSSVMTNTTQPGLNGYFDPFSRYTSGESGSPGGGIYNWGTLTVNNCDISGNSTGHGGDGLSHYRKGGDGGDGGQGAGIYNFGNATFVHCLIHGNRTGYGGQGGLGDSGYGDGQDGDGGSGGGIYNQGAMAINLTRIQDNSTGAGIQGGSGGGIFNNGSLTFSNNLLQYNETAPGGSGGGLFDLGFITTFNNSIVSDNSVGAGSSGSGLYLAGFSSQLIHTTIANNTGGDGSGIHVISTTLSMINTILVGQTVGISLTVGTTAALESTLWGSGVWANLADWGGSGSHTSSHDYYGDPGFVDPMHGDYHILPSSPAIDLGVQTGTVMDVDNQPRPNPSTGIPDLGADEYWPFVPISQVSINGQSPISATLEVTLTAIVSPAEATPNIVYDWSPFPLRGQGTDTAIYTWLIPGTYPITVTAWNAGSAVTVSQKVSVVLGPNTIFFPIVMRREGY